MVNNLATVCCFIGAFFNRYSRDVQPSVYRPGRLDQPLEAAEWMTYFRQMNESLLTQLDVCITHVLSTPVSVAVGRIQSDG